MEGNGLENTILGKIVGAEILTNTGFGVGLGLGVSVGVGLRVGVGVDLRIGVNVDLATAAIPTSGTMNKKDREKISNKSSFDIALLADIITLSDKDKLSVGI